jgi:hypothetical protein
MNKCEKPKMHQSNPPTVQPGETYRDCKLA